MLTNLLTQLGLTRDSKLFMPAKLLAVLTILANQSVDVIALGHWLGVSISPTMSHWLTALAVVVLFFAGHYDSSPLPGSPVPPKQ